MRILPAQAYSGVMKFCSFPKAHWVVLAVAIGAAVSVGKPARAAEAVAAPPHPCRVAGIKTEVLCGEVQRALDPARPDGVRIAVHYLVVPALARRKLPDPVFFLAGGPGQSAIKVAPLVLGNMARLNNRRDLVFVDQRGTGQSAPLECPEDRHRPLAQQVDAKARDAQVAQCLAQLQKLPYGDLRFFTTVLASQDLDAVRQALGAQRINLIGGSYGTRAALDYMRQFPRAVRRSVIDGVAPPDMVLPASFSTDGQASFESLLQSCEKDVACAKAHPALRANWAALLASLPKSVILSHPMTGDGEQVTLTRETVLSLVRLPLYSPVLASALPQAIEDAAIRARYEGLLGLGSGLGGRRALSLAMGMHFSVVCAEDFPRLQQATDQPGKDFGAEFAQVYQSACGIWPRGEVPAAFYAVAPASAPTLLLSGGIDPATPPRHAERVARALGAMAQHVVVANAGHGVMGLGCMPDVLARFIDAREEADAKVDASCVTRIPRPLAFEPVAPVMETAPTGAKGGQP
jgi:pimeloyl-ACP methyl ester carboxylesterase